MLLTHTRPLVGSTTSQFSNITQFVTWVKSQRSYKIDNRPKKRMSIVDLFEVAVFNSKTNWLTDRTWSQPRWEGVWGGGCTADSRRHGLAPKSLFANETCNRAKSTQIKLIKNNTIPLVIVETINCQYLLVRIGTRSSSFRMVEVVLAQSKIGVNFPAHSAVNINTSTIYDRSTECDKTFLLAALVTPTQLGELLVSPSSRPRNPFKTKPATITEFFLSDQLR